MHEVRRLERMIAGCPEKAGSEAEGLPPVAEEDFFFMEQLATQRPQALHIHPYVRKNASGESYIDIYIRDVMSYPAAYRRFVIREGYCFSEEDEDRFLGFILGKGAYTDEQQADDMYSDVCAAFPQWHYIKYAGEDTGRALHHLYFVSHRSGCREILYKAGLNNIAFSLECLSEYDISGSNPERIVGRDVPLKLLRILNNPALTERLRHTGELEYCKAVYRAYADHIGEEELTCGQWMYLEALYEGGGSFGGRSFSRALFMRLKDTGNGDCLERYRMFFELQEELKDFRVYRLPPADRVMRVVDEMEHMVRFTRDNRGVEAGIKRRKAFNELEYRGKDFSVILPADSYDFCREALTQSNCVMSYAAPHADGATTVLFIRRNEDLKCPYVTMEVSDRQVEQVFGRFNRIPEVEVLVFLEEYTRAKQIYYDPEYIIRMCLGAEADIEIELETDEEEVFFVDDSYRKIYRAYLEDFRKRMCWPAFYTADDEKEYRQLAFYDCFPWMA